MNSLCSISSSLRGFLPTHIVPTKLYENVQIVVREGDSRRVKLLSGGGSGHEPAHVGYVGPNHLTAAICGEIFASPSVQQILAGILASGGRDDTFLLIVNNYTGDWLNFSLARDIAKNSLGYGQIEILLVTDDIAIENVQESVGARGLAGCVLIIKIAGAMAEDGRSLRDIHSFCTDLFTRKLLLTVGFTFESNLKTGQISQIEIGKGIHGEPGATRDTNLSTFDDIAEDLLEKFLKYTPKGAEVIVMINNLGGTSQHILNVFSCSLLPRINSSFHIVHTFSGTFMTSLNQEGISVTLLNISDRKEILEYVLRTIGTGIPQPKPIFTNWDTTIFEELILDGNSDKQIAQKDPQLLAAAFRNACEDLLKECTLLNEMDAELGDGDTGSTISRGVSHFLTHFSRTEDFLHPGTFLKRLSWELSSRMGGSSGALYGIFFQAASTAFGKSHPDSSPNELDLWIEALHRGNLALQAAARSKRGDRTMLDPLLTIEDFLQKSSSLPTSVLAENISRIVAESAAATKTMIPRAGRAAYTTTTLKTDLIYPDPGAHAVAIWVRGAAKCFQQK
ncbi:PTS-dependent dihydroxyacetone kinase 1, dihydroxyacetone-binding subunit DhaK-like [Lutzomyia longipalpis]|uniref:PTS-dependent dihydroxyacetone kinase 1, dihydroxyacetone-binding subunit DhaK-like n=1 Tax=Lutzomyia longipalpis TaxID=7200 RepID=UPI002483A7A0|nr:PTS-dependent dihydroxyacetone kinase 1, dihydroxyacetone-binding subunit DhaK-like [Lutzomyia longipalpis]